MKRMLPALSLFALVASGCGAHFDFVRKADPNPFVGKTRFVVAAPDFSRATVEGDSLETWRGKEAQAKDWPDNQANAIREFFDELNQKKGALDIAPAGAASGDAIQIVPTVESFVPGFYIGIAARPTNVILHCTLYVNGAPADEVVFSDDVEASMYTPSFNQRMGDSLRDLADQLIAYLRWRTEAGH